MILYPPEKYLVISIKFGLTILYLSLISISDASGSESSSNAQVHQHQQPHQQQQYISASHHHSKPVVRNVDLSSVGSSSSSGSGHRYVTGGKYRSSFYYPKNRGSDNHGGSSSKSSSSGSGGPTLTSPSMSMQLPSSAATSGASSLSLASSSAPSPSPGGPNPVWVVWGRQGTPFDGGYQSQNPNNYYYQYPGDPIDRDDRDKYYNQYSYADDPYQALDSTPGHSWESLFRADSEEDELDRNDLDEISASQLKGLMKTRRTGFQTSLGGILSLKGLKLSAIGLFYLFRGVIILLWKFLPWIFLIMVAFLFIPVPILTIPANSGRSDNGQNVTLLNMTDMTDTVASLVSRVADSQQCVERISCEIRRQSRDAWFHPTLKMLIYQYKDSLPEPMQRMAKAYIEHRKCKLYSCHFFNNLKPLLPSKF